MGTEKLAGTEFAAHVSKSFGGQLAQLFVGIAQLPFQPADGAHVIGQPHAQRGHRQQHRSHAELQPATLGLEQRQELGKSPGHDGQYRAPSRVKQFSPSGTTPFFRLEVMKKGVQWAYGEPSET